MCKSYRITRSNPISNLNEEAISVKVSKRWTFSSSEDYLFTNIQMGHISK